MGPLGVGVASPGGRQGLGIADVVEECYCKKIVPESTVGALGVAILLWAARLDGERLDANTFQSVTQSVGNELRAVVVTNVVRDTTDGKQLGQGIDHVLAGAASVDSQGQALSRVLINESQPLEGCRSRCGQRQSPRAIRLSGPPPVVDGSHSRSFPHASSSASYRHFEPVPRLPRPPRSERHGRFAERMLHSPSVR